MDPGWPTNPPNALICILCKSAVPFNNSNPERFFRHLLADHFTFFNLNFLLEFSLMQPHATIWENSFPVPGRVQNAAETVLDQVKTVTVPVNKEKSKSSNLVEADSTSNKDQQTSQLLHESSSSEDINPDSISLEETCQTQSGSTSLKQSSTPMKSHHKTIACSNLQKPVQIQFNPHTLSKSDQLTHEDLNNNVLLNPISKQATEPQPISQHLGTHCQPCQPNQRSDHFQSLGLLPFNPTAGGQPDFSALDPISFVKQKPRPRRKLTRISKVNRNNQPVPCLPDKPNRNIVPEDLQMLISDQNPSRRIKFTYGRMMMDDYVLTKKKGPHLMRGGRVVNWNCINSDCHYTALTMEGQIQDTGSLHNHPTQADLCAKKLVKTKMRENMALESWNVAKKGTVNPVIKSVKDVVTAMDTNYEMKSTTEIIDARQEAEQHGDSQQDLHPNILQELSSWKTPSPDAFKNAYCRLHYEMDVSGHMLKKTIKTLMSSSVEKSMHTFSTHVCHNIGDLEFKSNDIVLSGEELAGSIDQGLINVSVRRLDEEEDDLKVSISKGLDSSIAENSDEDVNSEHVLQFYNF